MRKEEFVARVERNQQELESGRNRALSDIDCFRKRVHALAETIQTWLEGVPGVTVSVERSYVLDSPIVNDQGRNRFEAERITICYEGRSLRFQPKALNILGAKCQLELQYHGVANVKDYRLYMDDPSAPEGAWAFTIPASTVEMVGRRAGLPRVLDEREFFSLLAPLVS